MIQETVKTLQCEIDKLLLENAELKATIRRHEEQWWPDIGRLRDFESIILGRRVQTIGDGEEAFRLAPTLVERARAVDEARFSRNVVLDLCRTIVSSKPTPTSSLETIWDHVSRLASEILEWHVPKVT